MDDILRFLWYLLVLIVKQFWKVCQEVFVVENTRKKKTTPAAQE